MLVISAWPGGVLEIFCSVVKVAMDKMYGTRLVTTARLTKTLNCLVRSGLMVNRPSAVCKASRINMPTMGVPTRLVLAKMGTK